MPPPLAQAIDLLIDKRRILAFTGAGISTESGIPDFRGPDGVWKRVDPSEFTYDKYVSQPETRRRSWKMRTDSGIYTAQPNAAHRALAELWTSDLLIGCVTQNIDGLQQRAGLPDAAVVELHGNVRRTRCLECGESWPTEVVLARLDAGEEDPPCSECGGILKVAVISFGEMMPVDEMERAAEMAQNCDAVLAVGSTLSVYPAAYVPLDAKEAGAGYVIVNQGPTEQDHIADVRIEGAAGEILPDLVRPLVS